MSRSERTTIERAGAAAGRPRSSLTGRGPVVSIGSAKSGGTTTLALTLAATVASAGIPVTLIDAAVDPDLVNWAARGVKPAMIEVARCERPVALKGLVQEAADQRRVVLIDAGTRPETLRMAARLAETVLIPVRFSPLSAFAAAATDTFLATETRAAATRQAFVATMIQQIPSRIARAMEAELENRSTEKLSVGLAQRAAFEAPFLSGGTIFTLDDAIVPGLGKAQDDAVALAAELQLLGGRSRLAARAADAVLIDRRQAA